MSAYEQQKNDSLLISGVDPIMTNVSLMQTYCVESFDNIRSFDYI